MTIYIVLPLEKQRCKLLVLHSSFQNAFQQKTFSYNCPSFNVIVVLFWQWWAIYCKIRNKRQNL